MKATAINESTLLTIATNLNKRGPAWAQERVFLREVAEQLDIGDDLEKQQTVLACWQRLFMSGKLVWGYDLDNPGHPFFHIPAAAPELEKTKSRRA